MQAMAAQDGLFMDHEPIGKRPQERFEKEPLRKHIETQGPLSLESALEVTRQVLEHLLRAHSQGLPHGALGVDAIFCAFHGPDRPGNEPAKRFKAGEGSFGDLELRFPSPHNGEPTDAGPWVFEMDLRASLEVLAYCLGAELTLAQKGDLSSLFSARLPASVERLIEKYQSGKFPTAGFFLQAIVSLQRGRAWLGPEPIRRLAARLVPLAFALIFFGLLVRERSLHAAHREDQEQERARHASSLESLEAKRSTERALWEREREAIQKESLLLKEELGTVTKKNARSLAERIEERWGQLLENPQEAAFEEALSLARWFDDGRMAALVERFVEELWELPEASQLSPENFRSFPRLREWARGIETHPALALSKKGTQLLLFDHLQKTCLSDQPFVPLPPLLRSRIDRDFLGSLPRALRHTFLMEAFPGSGEVVRLYHEKPGSRWILETLRGNRKRTIERSVFEADGALIETRTGTLERSGRKVIESIAKQETSVEVALDRGQENKGARWESFVATKRDPASIPLKALGIPREAYLTFRAAFETKTHPALKLPLDRAEEPEAQPANERSILLSPLGELRRTEGALQRELVFTDQR